MELAYVEIVIAIAITQHTRTNCGSSERWYKCVAMIGGMS